MSSINVLGALAPFRVRSFRFQWPSDLLTSWAFEMETIILGWYILVETDSVLWLTLFGSLQFLGTLLAPMFGVMSDRLGRRAMLCGMRAIYALLACMIVTLSVAGLLNPIYVFIVAFVSGLIRPSDLVMRNALIGDTIPTAQLSNAMGVSRTTLDSARVAGALTGAGLFSQLGMTYAYVAVVAVYAISFLLTFGVSKVRLTALSETKTSPFRDLVRGLQYAYSVPLLQALLWLAFLVNLTAYPAIMGLMPYIAREIYHLDENGLSHLVAALAIGALLGSIFMILAGRAGATGKAMVLGIVCWFVLLLIFAHVETKAWGIALLVLIGFVQSIGMIAMSVTLLVTAEPSMRGRIMGVRMLAVYGLPIGLFAISGIIDAIGFIGTISLYAVVGLMATGLTVFKWRREILS
ncbi:MAG: MFS transporter [Rhodospirillaceae bacterium]|nr:MFS transporter [Rhodospirillaceae bacterium]MBT6139637.1 MFS transporter [Rhodospirillaceae bacterium]